MWKEVFYFLQLQLIKKPFGRNCRFICLQFTLMSFKLVYFYSDWICDQPRYICDTFTHVRQSDFDNRFSILESFTTLMTEPAPEFGSFSTPLNLYCSVTMQDRVWLRKRTTTKKRPKIFGDKPQ